MAAKQKEALTAQEEYLSSLDGRRLHELKMEYAAKKGTRVCRHCKLSGHFVKKCPWGLMESDAAREEAKMLADEREEASIENVRRGT